MNSGTASTKKIGFVTIGQTPRADMLGEIKAWIGKNDDVKAQIMETGALDGVSPSEVKDLKPQEGDDILVTRMRDGTEVTVGKSFIIPRMQDKIAELNKAKVDLVTLLCSGSFANEFESVAPLLYPYKLLYGMASSFFIQGRVGLLIPLEDQLEQMSKEIENLGFRVIGAAASPYSGNLDNMKEAAKRINKKDLRLVLMNCMGYTREMREIVKEVTGKPIILVKSLLARALSELFC